MTKLGIAGYAGGNVDEQRIEALQDALQVLRGVKQLTLGGPLWPWQRIHHAEAYVDRQISAEYANHLAIEGE